MGGGLSGGLSGYLFSLGGGRLLPLHLLHAHHRLTENTDINMQWSEECVCVCDSYM